MGWDIEHKISPVPLGAKSKLILVTSLGMTSSVLH